MKRISKIISLSLTVIVASLFFASPVWAIPTLPSSFYGTVKVNYANVPDGTVIQALIGGQVYAEGYTQTYQGDSVYALDVRGDDSGTTTVDGGREGDTIQFKIGGVLAEQTAAWKTATNFTLNLTASTSSPILAPQATTTPVPTQTAIVVEPSPIPITNTPTPPPETAAVINLDSSTPVSNAQSSPTPSSTAPSLQSSQTTAQSVQSSSVPAAEEQSASRSGTSENARENTPKNMAGIIFVVGSIAAFVGIGFVVIRALRKNI